MTDENGSSKAMGIHGLYVGQLSPEELEWFDGECRAGRAQRHYNWVGLAKVHLGQVEAKPDDHNPYPDVVMVHR